MLFSNASLSNFGFFFGGKIDKNFILKKYKKKKKKKKKPFIGRFFCFLFIFLNFGV